MSRMTADMLQFLIDGWPDPRYVGQDDSVQGGHLSQQKA
jgi:hypothetical protein